jgi:hypothetical protein
MTFNPFDASSACPYCGWRTENGICPDCKKALPDPGLEFVPTPSGCTYALLNRLGPVKGRIWEPFCGDGAIARILETECEGKVYASDLSKEHGYGDMGVDFMKTTKQVDWIITNTPHRSGTKEADKESKRPGRVQFKRHALRCARYVAFLMPLHFAGEELRSSEGRHLKALYIFRRPLDFINAKVNHLQAWYVWDRHFTGKGHWEWLGDPRSEEIFYRHLR